MTVGGMGFIPERLLMMMMMMVFIYFLLVSLHLPGCPQAAPGTFMYYSRRASSLMNLLNAELWTPEGPRRGTPQIRHGHGPWDTNPEI